MTGLWDYVNDILHGKQDLKDEPGFESEYKPFVVNQALTYHIDTILLANQMNINPFLNKRQQYQFLLGTVRPKKRWSKWVKKPKDDDLAAIQKCYQYSFVKAKKAKRCLSDEQIAKIKKNQEEGGIT